MSDPTQPSDPVAPLPGPPSDPTGDDPTIEPTPDPAPAPAPNVRSWLVAGGVAAVLAVGAGYVLGSSDDGGSTTIETAAATDDDGTGAEGDVVRGGPGGPGTMVAPGTGGTITAIDGSTLTVEADDGSSTTVETDDDTTIRETVDGTIEDLTEGDQVLVLGEADEDGNVAADTVVDNGELEVEVGAFPGDGPRTDGAGPPDGMTPPDLPDGAELPAPTDGDDGPGGFGRPTSGEITAVDGDTLTVETVDGTSVTVTLSDDTTVSVTEERDLSDLDEGDTVRVMGDADDEGVVTATSIQVGDAMVVIGPMGGPPGVGSADAADD